MKPFFPAAVLILAASLSCVAQDSFHRWTFEGGAGFDLPSGSATSQWNTGWNIKAGAGYNFTSHISTLLEWDFTDFGLSDQALLNYGQLGGMTHFWSLSADPRYDFNPNGSFDFYATGGYGLYSRTLFFTDPTQDQQYCDPYSGYCTDTGAPVIASFTNHKGGTNYGGGFSYKLGDSGLKFFVDARYHHFLSHTNNNFAAITLGIKY